MTPGPYQWRCAEDLLGLRGFGLPVAFDRLSTHHLAAKVRVASLYVCSLYVCDFQERAAMLDQYESDNVEHGWRWAACVFATCRASTADRDGGLTQLRFSWHRCTCKCPGEGCCANRVPCHALTCMLATPELPTNKICPGEMLSRKSCCPTYRLFAWC